MNQIFVFALIAINITLLTGVLVTAVFKSMKKPTPPPLPSHPVAPPTDITSPSAQMLLENAEREAQAIIIAANKKAQETMDSATLYTDQSKEMLKEHLLTITKQQVASLESASQEILRLYQETFKKVQDDSSVLVTQMRGKMEESTESEIAQFRKMLAEQTIQSQKIVSERIGVEFQEMQKELASYKQERLKKLDEDIFQILRTVTDQALGHALTFTDHKELITEALEEAKKGGEFSS